MFLHRMCIRKACSTLLGDPSLVGSSCYVGETCLLLVSVSRFAHPHARPRVLASLPAPPSASTAAPRPTCTCFVHGGDLPARAHRVWCSRSRGNTVLEGRTQVPAQHLRHPSPRFWREITCHVSRLRHVVHRPFCPRASGFEPERGRVRTGGISDQRSDEQPDGTRSVVAVGTMASERTSARGRRQLEPAATHEPEGGTKRWKKHGNRDGRSGTGSQGESGSERSTQEVLEPRDWLEDLRQDRGREKKPLPLRQINHISRVCSSLSKSLEFYRDVLGFVEIKRPDSFDFDGAW